MDNYSLPSPQIPTEDFGQYTTRDIMCFAIATSVGDSNLAYAYANEINSLPLRDRCLRIIATKFALVAMR